MKKRISDTLLGGFTGATAGTGALGGLGTAGLLTAGAVSPWAWGLIGGGAALGGISSLLSEDEVSPMEKRNMGLSNDLMAQQLEEKKEVAAGRRKTEKQRKQFSNTLGSMFAGSNLSSPSGRLL